MDNNFLSAEYIELQHTAIKKLILDQRLNEAISLLAPLVETIAQAELQYKLDEIRFLSSTYKCNFLGADNKQ